MIYAGFVLKGLLVSLLHLSFALNSEFKKEEGETKLMFNSHEVIYFIFFYYYFTNSLSLCAQSLFYSRKAWNVWALDVSLLFLFIFFVVFVRLTWD